MRTANEKRELSEFNKIALREFAESEDGKKMQQRSDDLFFQALNIKPQPYQRDIIKLIESGKTKRLKLVPLRPTSSLKHRNFFAELIQEHTKAYAEACSTGVGVMCISRKPTCMVINDVMDTIKYAVPPFSVKHIPAIVAIKATTLGSETK